VRESSFFSTVRSSVRVSLARVNVCGEIAVRCDPHEVAPRLAARRQRRNAASIVEAERGGGDYREVMTVK